MPGVEKMEEVSENLKDLRNQERKRAPEVEQKEDFLIQSTGSP